MATPLACFLLPLAALLADPPGILVADLDSNGLDDVRITGAAGAERILITETNAGGLTVSIDFNNDGDFDDAGDVNAQFVGPADLIEVVAGGGNDSVEYKIIDFLDVKTHEFRIDLGAGSDTFTYHQSIADIVGDSQLSFTILGGAGNDTLDIDTAAFTDSSLEYNVDLGAGNDTGSLRYFGAMGGSRAEANIVLGAGTNSFTTTWEVIPGSSCDVRVRVEGSNGKDTATLVAKRGASQTQRFEYLTDLGRGNDRFEMHAALNVVQLASGTDTTQFGRMRIEALGGEGSDLLLVDNVVNGTPNNGNVLVNGVLELLLDGGAGNDTLSLDWGTASFKAAAPPLADERSVRLRFAGGIGNDTMDLKWGDIAGFDANYDVLVTGDAGDDSITANVTSAGTPAFGISEFLVFDGGPGVKDFRSITTNISTRFRNFELQ
jgi:hypothetical protein